MSDRGSEDRNQVSGGVPIPDSRSLPAALLPAAIAWTEALAGPVTSDDGDIRAILRATRALEAALAAAPPCALATAVGERLAAYRAPLAARDPATRGALSDAAHTRLIAAIQEARVQESEDRDQVSDADPTPDA